ncbi:MAG: type II secretion system F family protein [Dehalococcoidia bacterium]
MNLLALLASVSVMGTVLALALSLYSSRFSVSNQIRNRLEGVLSGTSVVEGSAVGPVLRERRGVIAGPLASLLSGEWLEKLASDLERADTTLRPVEYITIRLTLAGLGFAMPYLLLGAGVMGMLGAVAGALVGFFLPRMYISRRRQGRVDKLSAQLPEALTQVSNSLKAGFGLLQSLDLTAQQMQHPVSTEFKRTIYEMNMGSTPEKALQDLAERSGSYDLDIVVTAILVQRTVGGNLSEILDKVAETMRERTTIRGEIKTLTAQQKMTGLVIGLLPLGVVGLLMVMSPDYMTVLFTATLGKVMLGIGVVLEAIGIVIIRRILSIEV